MSRQEALSAEETREDSQFENELVMMMATMEQQLAKVHDLSGPRRVLAALELSRGLIRQVVEFSERRLPSHLLAGPFQKAQDVFTQANLLQKNFARLPARVLAGVLDKTVSEAISARTAYRQLGQQLSEVLGEYLSLFAAAFRSPAKTGSWKETFRVFLADIARNW